MLKTAIPRELIKQVEEELWTTIGSPNQGDRPRRANGGSPEPGTEEPDLYYWRGAIDFAVKVDGHKFCYLFFFFNILVDIKIKKVKVN